ncbi:MAG: SpaA isopeptide-forming pilin-related protein [bacterium]|nr:SpaA isopeptide-forming pilin-related protein [bacterium]
MLKKIIIIAGSLAILAALVAGGMYAVKNSSLSTVEASGCVTHDVMRDNIQYTVDYSSGTVAKATVKNKSTTCTYKIGFASYKRYTNNSLKDQTLVDSQVQTLKPGETKHYEIDLPSCAFQVDLFEGEVMTPPYYNLREFARGFSSGRGGFCTTTPPPPPPAPKGCIEVFKEVYESNGTTRIQNPTQRFTFKLQNGQQLTTDSRNQVTFDNLPFGTYKVSEVLAQDGYTLMYPLDNSTIVEVQRKHDGAGTCYHIVFKNKKTPPPVTPKACILVMKEVYESNGTTRIQNPTQRFTFKLNNGTEVTTNSESKATFTSLPYGTYKVSEVLTADGYTLMYPTDNSTTVVAQRADNSSEGCYTVVFKNKKTATPPPSIPTPDAHSFCDAYTSKIKINWTAANRGAQGFHINITDSNDFSNGGWSKAVGSNVTSLTLSNFNDFAAFGGKSGTLSFDKSKTYRVRIYYPATGEVSPIDTVITRDCGQPVEQKGCIAILKETYDQNGTKLNTVAQFTFKLDNNRTTHNSSNGNAYFYDVPVGTHTVTEDVASGWTNYNVTPSNGTVQVTAGTNCAGVVFKNRQNNVPTTHRDLSLYCTASDTSIEEGDRVTYRAYASGGNGNYNYDWSGTDGLDGDDDRVSKTYNSSGSKTARIRVTSDGMTATAQCYTHVDEEDEENLTGQCWVTPSKAKIDETVTWHADADGGTGNYRYRWTGSDNLRGNDDEVTKRYSSTGEKYGTVTITSGNDSITKTCHVDIKSTPIVAAPTEPTPPKSGGVYLSQLPYTGASDNLKIGLFMLGLLAWSAALAYFFVQRKAKRQGMTVTEFIQGSPLAYANAQPVEYSVKQDITSKINAIEEHAQASVLNLPTDDTFTSMFGTAAVAATETKTVSKGEVIESLEARARELETLISADGLEIIADASKNNKHTAGIILNHLVELYKSSHPAKVGEWTVLNAEKVNQILFSTYLTMTPVFIGWLAAGDERKALSFVRMLQMQGQSVKDFMTHVVLELNTVYKYRANNASTVDTQILGIANNWSDEQLETVIHTLVGSINQTSKSTYPSIKIALMHVLDLNKTPIYA